MHKVVSLRMIAVLVIVPLIVLAAGIAYFVIRQHTYSKQLSNPDLRTVENAICNIVRKKEWALYPQLIKTYNRDDLPLNVKQKIIWALTEFPRNEEISSFLTIQLQQNRNNDIEANLILAYARRKLDTVIAKPILEKRREDLFWLMPFDSNPNLVSLIPKPVLVRKALNGEPIYDKTGTPIVLKKDAKWYAMPLKRTMNPETTSGFSGSRIIQLYDELEIGMTKEEVEMIVGAPISPCIRQPNGEEHCDYYDKPERQLEPHESPMAPAGIYVVYKNGKLLRKNCNSQWVKKEEVEEYERKRNNRK